MADEIFRVKAQKPIYAVANSLCASAAYWIGSQCSKLYCTPGGQVGSIGVYIQHQDVSKEFEFAGVAVRLISAGKFKTEGNPYAPLNPDARAAIQTEVNNYYGMFIKAVARGRGVSIAAVRDGMGKGRCLQAKDAMLAGMIDGIATLDQVIAQMQRPGVAAVRSPVGARRHDALRLALL